MLAKSYQWGSSDDRIVSPVLPSMKTIDEGAEYYTLLGKHVCLFILTDEDPKKVEDTAGKYNIGGRVYKSLGTNKFEDFQKEENDK